MSARDELIRSLSEWAEHPGNEQDAVEMIDAYAHELAEKIRLLPGDPWDEDEMWAQGVDYAADKIDPEVDK